MRLRRQLLLVSLLLLSIPWAGCQFLREIEGTLRTGQEQALQATAQAIAASLSNQPGLLYPDPNRLSTAVDRYHSIYARAGSEPIIVDGYADGWPGPYSAGFNSSTGRAGLSVSYQATTRDERLYLLLQVTDPDVSYQNPGRSPQLNGDRLTLRTWRNGQRQQFVIATAAPGNVRAQPAGPGDPELAASRIHGFWQDTSAGYVLELELPLDITGERLGFYISNEGQQTGDVVNYAGNVSVSDTAPPPWLIYATPALSRAVSPYEQPGRQTLVVDQANWLLARNAVIGHPVAENGDQPTFWLLRVLYRRILSGEPPQSLPVADARGVLDGAEITAALNGRSASHWYRDPTATTRSVISAAAPITAQKRIIGSVVLRQSSEQYLTLTDQAFTRLLGYSLLAMGLSLLGLLGFASLLSWRIRRLNSAARDIITTDGEIVGDFPPSKAGDEIGELSRSYADLLRRVKDFNAYLKTLSRSLSHELRTPIAVIKSSLENLERSPGHSAEETVYTSRAREGLQRLVAILDAMSEASQLEESISSNGLRELDLVPLLNELHAAYGDVYREHAVELVCEMHSAPVRAAPELLVQALDKLMDNAASFSAPDGTITLRLSYAAANFTLAVANEGPALPSAMQARLFDPMVSLRERRGDQPHLGLGLHIVKLVADYHGAAVHAINTTNGVRMELVLPALTGPLSIS